MSTMTDNVQDRMAHVSQEPDLKALVDELTRAATVSAQTARIDSIENTRFCRWPGQTSDGRKWDKHLGYEAFPWDGASDTRVHMADEVVNSLVDLSVVSFWRATLRVSPQRLDSSDQGAVGHALMDWLVRGRLYTELTRESELLAQYLYTYGWAGVHTSWSQEMGQKRITISMEQLSQMAVQAPAGTVMGDLPTLIANPEAEDQCAEILQTLLPDLTKRRALKAVRALRNEGSADVPMPTMVRNQPVVAALCPYDELVFPHDTTDIQSARVVFRRAWMSEIQLRQMAATGEWDEAWVEKAVVKHDQTTGITAEGIGVLSSGMSVLDRGQLTEVIYAYQKAVDDDGIPGVWCTVFCPAVTDSWAKHELLDYAHGMYPFTVWRAETIHRRIVDSRGAPEICATWQNEVKAQRDSAFDWTSLATIPPIEVPATRKGKIRITPAGQIPVMKRGEAGFMEPPQREPTVAFKLIEIVEAQVDRYFGRPTEKVPPEITQARQQRLVNNWLHGWTDVFRQMLSLAVQYLDPAVVARVTGIQAPLSQDAQAYDISLRFDARELNSDLLTDKMKAIVEVLGPADRAGVLDWGKLLPLLVRMLDPTIAAEVVMDKANASQKLFDETNQDIALMSLGNPAKLREMDPAAQMRMQFAQQIMGSNPKYQQQMKVDPIFAANAEKYAKNLQFSVEQQQNATIGRLGVDPSAAPQQQ